MPVENSLGMNLFSSSQPLSDQIGLLRLTTYARAFKFIRDNNLARRIINVTEEVVEHQEAETRQLFVKITYETRSLKVWNYTF